MSMMQEFKEFAVKGNAVELAVGVVVGAAFTKIVTSIVDDLINPLLGLVLGGTDFSNIFIPLKATDATTLAQAKAAAIPTVNIGLFLNNVISFLITAFAIFMLVKLMNRLRK